MKVDMALISSMNEKPQTGTDKSAAENTEKPAAVVAAEKKADDKKEEEEVKKPEKPEKHSKFKTFLVVIIMIVGFVLLVWNLTALVNNKRLDDQGSAVNIVYEMEDLESFMGNTEGSGATNITDKTENEMPTDTGNEDTEPEDDTEDIVYANESEEMAALRKEAKEARNEAALVRQELKNAEDMLDSSLQREADLQSQLDALTGGN